MSIYDKLTVLWYLGHQSDIFPIILVVAEILKHLFVLIATSTYVSYYHRYSYLKH